MIQRSISALALAFVCVTAALAQEVVDSPFKVPGLELPTPQTVNYDEGFVNLTAASKGQVEWLVLSTSTKIKYRVVAPGNELIVAIPPQEAQIVIFGVAVVDGKLTPFARTEINVRGPPAPGPGPGPAPTPTPGKLPVGAKLYITVIESPDPAQRTPEIAAVVTSAKIAKALQDAGHVRRLYVSTDPKITANPGLLKSLNRIGQLPALVVITSPDGKTGNVVLEMPLPKTEADFLNAINNLFAK